VTLSRPEPLPGDEARGVADEAAWRALYEEHFERIYGLVCRFGVPSWEAEDIAQTVFFRAHQKLTSAPAEKIEQMGAWLRGIAVRVVAERRRWARVRRAKSWLLSHTAEISAERTPTPEERAAQTETRREVAGVLARMSPKLAGVLVLLEIEQLSVEEAARALGVPENTVRSRRARAQARFEKLWTKRHPAREP